jgi:hypothetical protein
MASNAKITDIEGRLSAMVQENGNLNNNIMNSQQINQQLNQRVLEIETTLNQMLLHTKAKD